jgi:hypothetical protein
MIHRDVRSRINKSAHAAGLIAEREARKRLLAEVERMQAEKAPHAEILEFLDAETQRIGAP